LSDPWGGNWVEVAVTVFSPLLDVLADVPDPRRAEGKLYTLPYVLLFAILAIVTGCNSYRGIVTFIAVHRRRLNAVFGLNWRRAPARTAVRYILQGLDPAAVEEAFRHHAALLQASRATPGQGSIALDGKTLRGSFDKFNDRAAAQVLSAFASDTALVLAHMDIAQRSNEIPAAQTLLAEPGVADGAIITLDALHCQKIFRRRSRSQRSPDRRGQGQPADPAPASPRGRGHHDTARVCPQPRQGPQPRRTPHRHRL